MVPTISRAFDCTVGLFVPPESAEYRHVANFFPLSRAFEVGGPIKDASLQALKQLFAEVYEMPALPPRAGDPQPDFLIVLTIQGVKSWVEFSMFLVPTVHGELRMTWEVRDSSGQSLFSITHTGQESMEVTQAPGESEGAFWQRFAESCGKKVVSDIINELLTQHAGTFSELAAQRATTVGFLGWVCPTDLESMGAVLSDYVRKALEGPGHQVVSAEAVAAGLKRQEVSLAELITDRSKMVALARSLHCGALLVGKIQRDGGNLRLEILEYDGLAGTRVARAEEEAQPDDVKAVMATVPKMLSSLKLGQLAP
jgi:hypothetical protein